MYQKYKRRLDRHWEYLYWILSFWGDWKRGFIHSIKESHGILKTNKHIEGISFWEPESISTDEEVFTEEQNHIEYVVTKRKRKKMAELGDYYIKVLNINFFEKDIKAYESNLNDKTGALNSWNTHTYVSFLCER